MGRLQMAGFSVRDAKASRTFPCPEAMDGDSSFAAPEVSRCGCPATFQVFGDIAIRHKFVLSPDVAEKIKASPCGCHTGEFRSQRGAADEGLTGAESFAARVASSAPVLMAGPESSGVTYQSNTCSSGSFSSGLPRNSRCFPSGDQTAYNT